MVADRIDRLRFSPSSGVLFAVFSGVSYKREEKKKLSYFSSLFLHAPVWHQIRLHNNCHVSNCIYRLLDYHGSSRFRPTVVWSRPTGFWTLRCPCRDVFESPLLHSLAVWLLANHLDHGRYHWCCPFGIGYPLLGSKVVRFRQLAGRLMAVGQLCREEHFPYREYLLHLSLLFHHLGDGVLLVGKRR